MFYTNYIAYWCCYGFSTSPFRSSQANATDLQGEISLVLASLSAEGITEISATSHVDRGYENLEMKLQGLSANAIRTTTTTYLV